MRRQMAALACVATALTGMTVTPATAVEPVTAGLTCGLTAASDPTRVVNQDPNVRSGVLTVGPWAGTEFAEAGYTEIHCWVQVNDASPRHAASSAHCDFAGVAVGGGACAASFTASETDNVYVCTRVDVTRNGSTRAYHYDEDDNDANGVQCAWWPLPWLYLPTTCWTFGPAGGIGYSPMPVDVGTGEQGYVPDPIGAVDTKWRTGPAGLTPAYSVPPYAGVWYDSATSNWISDTPTSRSATPVTVYRMEFDLPLDTLYGGIVLRYAADNGVTFRLNGVTLGGYAGGPTDSTAFNQLHEIAVPFAPIHPGPNLLEATVTDYGVVTGLLVEGGVYACRF